MSTPSQPMNHFDGFELDRTTGQLQRLGVVIPLPEQGFRVLATLIDHAGRPVSREQLQELLWPGDTAGDFDNKLNGVIRKIRNALGDDSAGPRYVETLPRRGYRFIGILASPDGRTIHDARRSRPRSMMLAAIALAVVVAVVGMAEIFPWRVGTQVPRLACFHLK